MLAALTNIPEHAVLPARAKSPKQSAQTMQVPSAPEPAEQNRLREYLLKDEKVPS
jgi:hypothetical protein